MIKACHGSVRLLPSSTGTVTDTTRDGSMINFQDAPLGRFRWQLFSYSNGRELLELLSVSKMIADRCRAKASLRVRVGGKWKSGNKGLDPEGFEFNDVMLKGACDPARNGIGVCEIVADFRLSPSHPLWFPSSGEQEGGRPLLRGNDSVREYAAGLIKPHVFPSMLDIFLFRTIRASDDDLTVFFDLACEAMVAAGANSWDVGCADLDKRGDDQLTAAMNKGIDISTPSNLIADSHDMIFISPRARQVGFDREDILIEKRSIGPGIIAALFKKHRLVRH